MEVFAVDKLAGREEAVPIEADATLSAVKRQCGEAFGFGDDVELSVGGQRVACDDAEAVSIIAAFSGGCRVQVERGVREFVKQLLDGETTMDDIPLWARTRRECVLATLKYYCGVRQNRRVKQSKKRAPFPPHWVPPSLYDDKEVMQQLVYLCSTCFSLASPALRRDVDVALASLRNRSTKYASTSLAHFPNREMWLNHKEFVLGALESRHLAFKDISTTLRDDKDVVMMAMDLETDPNEFEEDNLREVMLSGNVQIATDMLCGDKLRYRDLSMALRGDKEVALKAIESDVVWFEFQYMSEELRGDKDVALEALEKGGYYARDAVQHMGEELRADKTMGLHRGDKAVAMKAVESDYREFQYLSEQLRGDKELAMLALEGSSGEPFRHMSEALRGDKEVVLMAIEGDSDAHIHMADVLRDDRDFASRIVTACGGLFRALPDALRDDVQVALPAIRKDPENFMYAGEHVRGDRQAALAAFADVSNKSNGALLAFASADLQADREVALQAVRANPQNVSYASPALQACLQEEAAV